MLKRAGMNADGPSHSTTSLEKSLPYMNDPDTYFVVPTHRLRDVSETIHEYDEHFWRNGHSPQMIVFDDSTPTNVEKYFTHLDQIKTRSDLFYVGPRQKEEFLTYINSRLRNKRLEPLVKNLFRPSYGGNRNYTLMYSLGGLMVSSDDDMRPYSLMEDSPESLENNEISRGEAPQARQERLCKKVVRYDVCLLRRPRQAGL
jgi:hypothetical protein